jgi:hypothetical protein
MNWLAEVVAKPHSDLSIGKGGGRRRKRLNLELRRDRVEEKGILERQIDVIPREQIEETRKVLVRVFQDGESEAVVRAQRAGGGRRLIANDRGD